jgi:hypothetical protein
MRRVVTLLEDGGGDEDLLADHGVILVVGVVGIAKHAVGAELEFQELVPKLPLVSDTPILSKWVAFYIYIYIFI